MVPVPVRNAFGIAHRATGFVTWTRGALIAATAAGLKYLLQPKPMISWDALYFTFVATLLWYLLVLLKHLIVTVPTTLSAQVAALEQGKTRIEGDRDGPAAAVRAAHDDEARIAPLLATIATLKTDAREIKRRWPNCTFVKFPTHRLAWSPFIGQPETGEQNPVTLDKRIA
jgi:outer membrane murein-binding lipoprotein Lpp